MNRIGGYSGRNGFGHKGDRFKEYGCFPECSGPSNDEVGHTNNGTKCYCICCNIF